MIPVSGRFIGALSLVLAATAGLRLFALADAHGTDPCRSPDALKATSLIPGAIALGERRESLDRSTIQWSEGDLVPSRPAISMRFQIIRSFDGPFLYGNPLRHGEAFGRGLRASEGAPVADTRRLQPEELRVRRSRVAGAELPIHVAWDHTEAPVGPSRLVAWFFVFDNAPVESPFRAQLRAAASLALRGSRPLTLVLISGSVPHETVAMAEDVAVSWLEGAWTHVAESCRPR